MGKENTCCFTGHRVLGADFNIDTLYRGIKYLISQGIDTFICGGATGFDTACAKAVLDMKRECPQIKLHIYAPCSNQSAKWEKKDVLVYEEILKKADLVDMPSTPYYDGCMRARNYKMVDNSSFCICYLNNPRSGTGQTHRYAKNCGLTVFNIAGKK